jgi:predicted nucleic acid-binding protein
MVKALFDTNIIIDHLNKVPTARAELDRYESKAISMMTWIEVMVGATPQFETATRAFLDRFEIVQIDATVADEAVTLRKRHRIKTPDAIIWASARAHGMLLVTRNTKDFPPGDPGVRMPYKI